MGVAIKALNPSGGVGDKSMLTSFFNKFKKIPSKKLLRDPVCGMRASDSITFTYKDKEYVFCSDHCRSQFEKDPESYIKK